MPKSLSLLVFIISLLPMAACDSDYDCYSSCTEEETGANLGYIPFQDSTAYWLPSNPENLIVFRNNNSQTVGFTLLKDTTPSKPTVKTYSYKASPCCNELVKDYVSGQRLQLRYNPVQNFYPVIFAKEKLISSGIMQADTLQLQGHEDLIYIKIAESYCYFKTGVSNYQFSSYTFIPQVTLNGLDYTDVYMISGMNSNYNASKRVDRIYFKPGTGVLAFRFENGEVWAKE